MNFTKNFTNRRRLAGLISYPYPVIDKGDLYRVRFSVDEMLKQKQMFDLRTPVHYLWIEFIDDLSSSILFTLPGGDRTCYIQHVIDKMKL